MFIKTNENDWINLDLCKKVQIQKTNENKWKIIFLFVNVGPDSEFNSSIGPYDYEIEAQEVLDIIWCVKQQNKPVWSPEPDSIFKVTIPDVNYSEWSSQKLQTN